MFGEERLRRGCEVCRITDGQRDQILGARAEICASLALLGAAKHCYAVLFRSSDDVTQTVKRWPPPRASDSPAVRLLYAVVYLAGVPEVEARHAALGIGGDVTRATMGDIALWLRESAPQGAGLVLENIAWLARHCQCRLFRIGRLQVELTTYGGVRSARATGAPDADDDEPHAPRTWALRHKERRWLVTVETTNHRADSDSGQIAGRVVDPRAQPADAWRRFPLDDWETVLAPGDQVAAVHVPADGAMTWGDIVSFAPAAVKFLDEHFSALDVKAFYLRGWLLDPLLEGFFPSASPIARLRGLVYCLAVPGADSVEPAPSAQSSLGRGDTATGMTLTQKRALVRDLARSGGAGLAGGAAFYLLDDIARAPSYGQTFAAWRKAGMSCSEPWSRDDVGKIGACHAVQHR